MLFSGTGCWRGLFKLDSPAGPVADTGAGPPLTPANRTAGAPLAPGMRKATPHFGHFASRPASSSWQTIRCPFGQLNSSAMKCTVALRDEENEQTIAP